MDKFLELPKKTETKDWKRADDILCDENETTEKHENQNEVLEVTKKEASSNEDSMKAAPAGKLKMTPAKSTSEKLRWMSRCEEEEEVEHAKLQPSYQDVSNEMILVQQENAKILEDIRRDAEAQAKPKSSHQDVANDIILLQQENAKILEDIRLGVKEHKKTKPGHQDTANETKVSQQKIAKRLDDIRRVAYEIERGEDGRHAAESQNSDEIAPGGTNPARPNLTSGSNLNNRPLIEWVYPTDHVQNDEDLIDDADQNMNQSEADDASSTRSTDDIYSALQLPVANVVLARDITVMDDVETITGFVVLDSFLWRTKPVWNCLPCFTLQMLLLGISLIVLALVISLSVSLLNSESPVKITNTPTNVRSQVPSHTISPSFWPTSLPSRIPTKIPTENPSLSPTKALSTQPTSLPSISVQPSTIPTSSPVPSQAPSSSWKQIGSAIDGGATGEEFMGLSVAISSDGSRLCAGGNGVVRMFDFVTDSGGDDVRTPAWTQILDISSYLDGTIYNLGLSPDGSTFIVGESFRSNSDTGTALVFQQQQGEDSNWTQKGQTLSGEKEFDYFGYAVSISDDGSCISVGTYGGEYVKILKWVGNGWDIHLKLESAAAEVSADFEIRDTRIFGGSLAMTSDGSIIIVGALQDHENGDYCGAVFFFNLSDGVLIQKINGDIAYDLFGGVVAISDNGILAAVSQSGEYAIGYVKVFKFDGNVYIQVGDTIEGSDTGYDTLFGYSVALSGDGRRLAIGAPSNDEGALDNGKTFVYSINDNDFELIGEFLGEAPSDRFGASVALSQDGKRVASGAAYNWGRGQFGGHVRVYEHLEI